MNKQLHLEAIESLFDEVQRQKIFEDQKMMTDAIPRYLVQEIMSKYEEEKTKETFNLKEFVLHYFDFPTTNQSYQKNDNLSIEDHIEKLWDHLTKTSKEDIGTLLQLPEAYIVPGGRFNEFFYWDSFFIMLGLKESGRVEMMRNIVDNCAYLIHKFGFIPNASRTYFLSRSQPPYFSLMLQLLADTIDDKTLLVELFPTLEKEYNFWMKGEQEIVNNQAINRVVKLEDGTILNRYYDAKNQPRPESYWIDVMDNEKSDKNDFYRNIRAACESGWDFSSRWFADSSKIETIEKLNILPVDLNCLLWNTENLLSEIIQIIDSKSPKIKYYQERANSRKAAIQNYFWNDDTGIYVDYNFSKKSQTSSEHVGMLYPLLFKLAENSQADKVRNFIENNILHKGGLVTTTKESKQQWDFPNAWAPFQWLGYQAFEEYNYKKTSLQIAENWCALVEKTYNETGKLMEKYNAVDLNVLAGGGEYPNQDGFGWTNGVYLFLKNKLNS